MTVYGTDYPTPDGTCIRDYIHVTDLVAAHADALQHLRAGGESLVANCGYGRGYSVLEVIDTVKRVSGRDFKVIIGGRRPGDPTAIVAAPALIMSEFGWKPRHDDLDGDRQECARLGDGARSPQPAGLRRASRRVLGSRRQEKFAHR